MMTPFVTPGLEKHTIPHAITASTRPSTNDSTTPLMFSVTCGNTRRSTLSGNQLLLSATGQSRAGRSTKTGAPSFAKQRVGKQDLRHSDRELAAQQGSSPPAKRTASSVKPRVGNLRAK